MATAEDVRAVCDHLPRAYEVQVRGRWKYRVGQIVFTSFSHDERDIGFGFPKAEREGLIESDPDTFFLPPPRDLRFGWVCAHLDRLDPGEVRELVIDAWRMCTPRMLHDLPEQPAPAADAWAAVDAADWAALRDLLHPRIRWTDRDIELHGRNQVLSHLRHARTPRPPTYVEVADGQVRRWTR